MRPEPQAPKPESHCPLPAPRTAPSSSTLSKPERARSRQRTFERNGGRWELRIPRTCGPATGRRAAAAASLLKSKQRATEGFWCSLYQDKVHDQSLETDDSARLQLLARGRSWPLTAGSSGARKRHRGYRTTKASHPALAEPPSL